ncbi:LysR family transcriptional regulator [Amycolatopsis sp. PS_44_ISF1]|uniref:LysR family transcriptional regulator n=1 Tax=Amycolatopsis sp. PS_44_ISF1 TaxID=2974917 RepID=UPI0028E07818|nr:LysR family transcriptional regulator [Amycolatopsis sp. PS_44_ISF1]MDT8915304.1 LysR family transcriptional regulator [Amycolatopsis sp. PS_44_ISF1]
MGVEIRQLRHFLALVEEGSFTQAARREFIVQSGLSSSIRALEQDLGVALYVKGTRPLRLTAEGRALIPAAREALRGFDSVHEAVGQVSRRLTGRLGIGVFTHVEHLVPLAAVLSRMTVLHPGLELGLAQLPTEEMVRLITAGRLDCALLSATGAARRELDLTRLAAEPFVLAGSRDHPLGHAPSIALGDLANERFVDVPRYWAVRTRLDRLFREAGLRRRQVCEVDDWGLALDLVAGGAGLAFLPRAVAEQGRGGGVWHQTLTDVELERRIDFALPRGDAASPAARRLRVELVAAVS